MKKKYNKCKICGNKVLIGTACCWTDKFTKDKRT